jgi:hypothetical protein
MKLKISRNEEKYEKQKVTLIQIYDLSHNCISS